MILGLSITLAILLLIAILCLPVNPSLREEKRLLLEYFREKDAADARGEPRYPP